MRIALFISLVLNLYLGYLVARKDELPPLERIVIETKEVIKEVPVAVTGAPVTPKPETKPSAPAGPMDVLHSEDVTEIAKGMEQEKREFLEKDLRLPAEKITQHQKLREAFFKASMKFDQEFPNQEPTLGQRRQLLDLEENYYKQLELLYGKNNWERFEKYRRSYNQQGLKKQREENQPFIFMTP